MYEFEDRKLLIKVSVKQVVREIWSRYFPHKKYVGLEGLLVHEALGFSNKRKYCRTLSLPYLEVKICGIPDRVLYIKRKPFLVDELKTTVYEERWPIIVEGLLQLHLYLYITRAQYGRLFLYYKDRGELIQYIKIPYDERVAVGILDIFLQKITRKYHQLG